MMNDEGDKQIFYSALIIPHSSLFLMEENAG